MPLNKLNQTPPTSPARWGTVAAAVQTFGLPRTALYGLLGEGELRTTKIGRRRLIDFESLNEFLTKRAAA